MNYKRLFHILANNKMCICFKYTCTFLLLWIITTSINLLIHQYGGWDCITEHQKPCYADSILLGAFYILGITIITIICGILFAIVADQFSNMYRLYHRGETYNV
jgi:hypothetical protein